MSKLKISVKPKAAHPAQRAWIVTDFDDLPDYRTIYHISDIHIRPLQRHDEFREVFENLDTFLSNRSNGSAIAVITGDTFDNKNVFRPETFKICRDMMKRIANRMPLVVIAGNHDMMENNTSRLDAITPVVDDIPNLYYLKYTGLYFCPKSHICLSVSSLYDKEFITFNDIKSSPHYREQYQYISLYHGTLNGAKTDTGYVASDTEGTEGTDGAAGSSSRFRSLSDFDGYNAVLLGDIHKHQVMRTVPPVAYAGSLIQQNHGENIDGHGVLVWNAAGSDKSTWTCQLHDIKNHYGFVDIICEDGSWINTDVPLPKHCYARLIIKNCTETQVDIIVAQLKERIVDGSITITKRQCISSTLDDFEIPPDIKRKEDELDLIREQAEANHYDSASLIKLHQEYQQTLDVDVNAMSTAVWRPVTLEFKNMFGYGEGHINKMRFKRGTISISAGNACGKTSIVNIILFAIFGRTPLNPSSTTYTYDIINNKESSGYVRILLNHGGKYYLIERRTIRKNTKTAASTVLQKLSRYDFSCDIWESNIRGEKLQNCSETRRNNNDTFIKELFGDINDFSLSNLLNKESSLDLLSMTPVEQIKVLKRLFKLEVYDQYKELNKTKLQAIEKDIDRIGIERKTLQPLVDASITRELISSHELMVTEETNKLNELKSQLALLIKEQKEFVTAIHGYRSELRQVRSDDLPLTDAERSDHQLQLDEFSVTIPKDTGMPTQALQYKLEDLQRQIDNIEGTIDTLSAVPDQDALKSELAELEEQLHDLESQKVHNLQDLQGLTESQLNRRLGDYTSRLELVNLQLNELHERTSVVPEGLKDLNSLRKSLHPLNTSLTAITERLDQISKYLGDDDGIEDSQVDETNLKLLIAGIGSDISRLESDNRQLEIKRDRTYIPDGPDTISELQEQLYPDTASHKFAVTQADLARAQEQLTKAQDSIKQLCSGKGPVTFDHLTQQLEHSNHPHTPNGSECILSSDIVDDVISYLHNGDQIRKLDIHINRTQALVDKIQEQLEINQHIDHNNELHRKIAQTTYIENQRKITQLQEQYNTYQEQLEKHHMVQEYKRLCEEESHHYDNQEIQVQIDYLEAMEKVDKLTIDRQTLDSARSEIENRILCIEVEHNIKQVRADLDAHQRLNELHKTLIEIKRDFDVTETQLAKQEVFDHYRALNERDQRLQTYDYNVELQSCIRDVQSDLDQIDAEIVSMERELMDQDNHVKALKEKLSVLNYRYQEQDNIRARLEQTEQQLIQLEKDIIPYQEYNSIIGNKGITSKLLYNKIKAIEDYINSITQKFTKYTIHIVYDDKKQTINIITEADGHYLSTARLCGFEKLMLQIAFKRALNKFSYNSKSSLVIVDEAIDCIDQGNFLTKLPEAINLITQDYANCLVISQRDIAHISDSIITITQQGGCSRLIQ